MPKQRKRRRSTSSDRSESGIYKLLKKIDKRLTAVERKQSRRFRYDESGSDNVGATRSSSSSHSRSRSHDNSPVAVIHRREGSYSEKSVVSVAVPQNSENVDINNLNDNANQQNEERNNVVIQEPGLQDEILSILGKDQEGKKLVTDPIRAEIASRWSLILTSGLEEAVQKELLQKHLPPENCPLLKPPTINPEVKVAISESIIRRDGRLITLQQQVGASMSAIGMVLTTLLSDSNVDKTIIQHLSDAGRLLANIHHLESVSHRELIALNLNKELKETLTDTPIGNLLFGEDLDYRIRAVKELEKSGQQLKPKNKNTKPVTPSSGVTNRPGNAKSLFFNKCGVQKGGQIRQTPHRMPQRKTQEVQRKRPVPDRYYRYNR